MDIKILSMTIPMYLCAMQPALADDCVQSESQVIFSSEGKSATSFVLNTFGWQDSLCVSDDYMIVVDSVYDNGDFFDVSKGAIFAFENQGGEWVETSKVFSENGDQFWSAAAISGDFVLLGVSEEAPDSNFRQGAVHVFKLVDGSLEFFTKLNAIPYPDDGTPQIFTFGQQIAIDDNVIVVGAETAHTDAGNFSGAAYVYRFDGTTWNPETRLLMPNVDFSGAADDARFGRSVDVSGNAIVIGAHTTGRVNPRNTGAAYTFRHDGSTWVPGARLLAENLGDGIFGFDVAIDGDDLVVGEYRARDTNGAHVGAVQLYRYESETWNYIQRIEANDPQAGAEFGFAVDIKDGLCVVGEADRETSSFGRGLGRVGTAYAYERDVDGQWLFKSQLHSSHFTSSDQLGRAVAISSDHIVLGVPGEDNAHEETTGAIFSYTRSELCSEDCLADFNADGSLNFFDISLFLSAFSSEDPIADLTQDGLFNFFDVSAFLTAFNQGCP